MTKTNKQISNEIEKVEAKLAELRKELEKNNTPESPIKALDGDYWYLSSTGILGVGPLSPHGVYHGTADDTDYVGAVSESAAKDLTLHLDTMLRLRGCDGVVSAENGEWSWVIELYYGKVLSNNYSCCSDHTTSLSPAFKDNNSANAAIELIGAEAIKDMFLYFNAYKQYQEKYPEGKVRS